MYDCEIKLTFQQHTAPVCNSPRINRVVRAAAIEILGSTSVVEIEKPSKGAEDFAFLANKRLTASIPTLTDVVERTSRVKHFDHFDVNNFRDFLENT